MDTDFLHQPKDMCWAATVPLTTHGVMDARSTERESELRRLAALEAHGLSALQYVAETAARICDTPMSAVTIVDDRSVWFHATVGVELKCLPHEHTFCPRVLNGKPEAMVIHDALADARFASLPTVTGYPGVRFYAGVPFASQRGVALGVVCVMDTVPRELSPVQVRTLELLAHQTGLLLEARASRGHQPSLSA